ncbi:hypothetical protein HZ326_4975 [Fusarium oxysporum f. sp. albedinis]|nr:hypothetical protein HZ326_4975 [Fusarium oxysporum f. sp. albedinis]
MSRCWQVTGAPECAFNLSGYRPIWIGRYPLYGVGASRTLSLVRRLSLLSISRRSFIVAIYLATTPRLAAKAHLN